MPRADARPDDSATPREYSDAHPAADLNTGMSSRTAALRYAAWNWPITPRTEKAASTDLERIFATWSRMPQAPILAACGVAFDVVEAQAASGRIALSRLDRLGVQLGPVLVTPRNGGTDNRISFLVRVDTVSALGSLVDPGTGPALLGRGDHIELPRFLGQPRAQAHRAASPIGPFWLRAPSTARPALPAAHVVLGALALAPRHAHTLAGSRVVR